MCAYAIGISVKFCCSLNVKERIADQINNQKVPKEIAILAFLVTCYFYVKVFGFLTMYMCIC